jgi:hypothetical protein
MSSILKQLKALRKQIKIPYRIEMVDKFIHPKDFEEFVIYIHIKI